jgi:hypothetical protein
MSYRQAATRSAIAVVVAFGLVVGAPLGAHAAITVYHEGFTIQNQTKHSGSHWMNGGSLASSVGFITLHMTVSGIGTHQGNSAFSQTWSGRTTSQYCKWTWSGSGQGTAPMICRYLH